MTPCVRFPCKKCGEAEIAHNGYCSGCDPNPHRTVLAHCPHEADHTACMGLDYDAVEGGKLVHTVVRRAMCGPCLKDLLAGTKEKP